MGVKTAQARQFIEDMKVANLKKDNPYTGLLNSYTDLLIMVLEEHEREIQELKARL